MMRRRVCPDAGRRDPDTRTMTIDVPVPVCLTGRVDARAVPFRPPVLRVEDALR